MDHDDEDNNNITYYYYTCIGTAALVYICAIAGAMLFDSKQKE